MDSRNINHVLIQQWKHAWQQTIQWGSIISHQGGQWWYYRIRGRIRRKNIYTKEEKDGYSSYRHSVISYNAATNKYINDQEVFNVRGDVAVDNNEDMEQLDGVK